MSDEIEEVVPVISVVMPPFPDHSHAVMVKPVQRPPQAEVDLSFVLEEFARHRARGQMK